jgi:BCD family chlorophyll transporter-like MFS transporter
VQASAAGLAILGGGALRDGVGHLAVQGWFGSVMQSPVTGYSVVYHLEMFLLFAALVAIGPLVRRASTRKPPVAGDTGRFGLADLPA